MSRTCHGRWNVHPAPLQSSHSCRKLKLHRGKYGAVLMIETLNITFGHTFDKFSCILWKSFQLKVSQTDPWDVDFHSPILVREASRPRVAALLWNFSKQGLTPPPPPYFCDLWTFSDTFLNSWLKLTEHTTKLLRWWQMHFRRPKETLPYGMIPILPHMATLEIATPMQTATWPSLTTFFCGSPRARFGSNLSPSLICTL